MVSKPGNLVHQACSVGPWKLVEELVFLLSGQCVTAEKGWEKLGWQSEGEELRWALQ